MSNLWTCPQCGGHTNHFNRTVNGLVCDSCGMRVQSEAEREEDINFERSMVLARDHLRVGNWEEAKQLVMPFCESRPADKQLYLMLLVAVTKCFTDFLLNDYAKRKEAAGYWDKLERLGCVNSMMREYANQRIKRVNELRSVLSAKKRFAYGLCALLTFITICTVVIGGKLNIFSLIVTIIGWFIVLNWAKTVTNKTTMQLLPFGYAGSNPFR